jgi:lipoprotein-anchoring transpeptidase ErfK/SrfK
LAPLFTKRTGFSSSVQTRLPHAHAGTRAVLDEVAPMKKGLVSLAAAAACVAGAIGPASAIEAVSQRALYARQAETPPQIAVPRYVAAGRAAPSQLGGGFIEFLFSDGRSGSPPDDAGRYRVPSPSGYPGYPAAQGSLAARAHYGAPAQPEFDPRYEKQLVAYGGKEAPGTSVVDTPAKFLYLVQPGGQALRYGIGVGRPGFTWAGIKQVSAKREWPSWTPPAEMLKRRPDLPRFMEGGPDNPLGARALYLGSSLYRIHGSNEPWTIGTNVSSGCIRMRNQDVIDLYERVRVGTRVVVL